MTEISKVLEKENGGYDMEASNLMISSISNSLSDYIVVGPLGRGAGSFVYKIRLRKSQKESVSLENRYELGNIMDIIFFEKALKVIDKKQTNFEILQKRLDNEIEIHSQLNHKHIVKLLNNFEDSDNFYILLELCEGGELYTYLKSKGRLTEDETKKFTFQLAQALYHLHSNMIIHRDLKLGNLLLTTDGDLKICDFGLAVKLIDSKPERNTICGTPNYISPEIINKEPYGMKSDCWSFGCILYALITGNPPFEGDSVQETLRKVKKSNLLIPNTLSSELKDLLMNVINWDPHARYDINQILSHPFYTGSVPMKMITHPSKKTRYPLEEKENFPFNNSNNIIKHSVSMKNAHEMAIKPNKKQKELENFIIDHNNDEKVLEKHKDAITPYVDKFKRRGSQALDYSSNKLVDRFNFKDERDYENKENYPESSNEAEIQTFSPFIAKKNIVKNIDQTGNTLREHFFFQTPKLESLNTSWDTPGPENSRLSFTLQSTSKKASANRNNSITSNILNNTNSKINGISSKEFDFEACLALTPLCTEGLSPNKFNTKKGRIEVKLDLSIELELCEGKVLFCVQKDGYKISITKKIGEDIYFKTYPLFQLPTKYHSFYTYARQVTDSLRSKTPRVKLQNEFGKFMLMINSPFPNFEAHFINGWRAIHKVSSDKLVLTSPRRRRKYEISINDNTNNWDPEIENMVDLTLNYLGVCIEEEQSQA